ncbi:protein kinase [Mycobacterium asiaticum]|uniref:non-specific serine/threonine protein kinase n=1 Tax=Mycobacterium asiaticum TaxID=1790 RepID=A0A1A3NQG2_MYCAS|nr:serine/threonine-protein kinase [Mycobacterium asiaticum]OBK24328.1 protein kinase [Mycobacterium asiaticum]
MTELVGASRCKELTVGEVFAGYKIVRFLGAGGMGEVYLAEHPRLPRREALKILGGIQGGNVSADDAYRQRFIREADLAATLWHPNIVRVNDRGEFNGQLWISMDFVDGTDAASLLRDHYPGGMPADQVSAIVTAIAGALDYAHQQHKLMHRDVSPANILLSESGDGEQRILLGDFGIARTIGDSGGLTATNMTIGTFPYAAPEQLTDDPIDGRADQYALAATVYHLLTGSPLFPHENPAVVISRHLSAPPPTLAQTHPMLRVFDPVLATALAKDPGERYPTCGEFAHAFTQAAQARRHPTASALTMPRPMAVRSHEHTAAPVDKARQRSRRRMFASVSAVVALTAVGASGYPIGDPAPPVAAPALGAPALAEPQPAAQYAPPQAPVPQPVVPAPNNAPPAAVPVPVQAPAPVRPPAPTRVLDAAPPVPPQPAANPDQTFLNLMSGIPGVTVTDPATAVSTGQALCSGLQNGGSPRDAAEATVRGNEGITPAQAAAGVNAAITAYCPQYSH